MLGCCWRSRRFTRPIFRAVGRASADLSIPRRGGPISARSGWLAAFPTPAAAPPAAAPVEKRAQARGSASDAGAALAVHESSRAPKVLPLAGFKLRGDKDIGTIPERLSDAAGRGLAFICR